MKKSDWSEECEEIRAWEFGMKLLAVVVLISLVIVWL